MSKFTDRLSGRAARRRSQFGDGVRRKGAGWTRTFRKGRTQRLPRQEEAT